MQKFDVKKELSDLYNPKNRDWQPVDVPPMHFLMVDGAGDPNTAPAYREAVEALYSVSYGVKFASKKSLERDYVVAPLEGLWRADDPGVFVRREKDQFRWTMMIRQPEWIDEQMVTDAVDRAAAKKDLPALPGLRFSDYDEGRSVQLLHSGPYDDEGPALAQLHDEYMPAHGLTFGGDHHEIYLSDPRRAEPSRMKTIVRQPVRNI
ncbi:GyrI-like domain-containing protein [Gordonia sinesedis]